MEYSKLIQKVRELVKKMLKRSKEKGLHSYEQETKLMLRGFLKGVRFFNPALSYELYYIAGKAIS